jgi:hypothetical protein
MGGDLLSIKWRHCNEIWLQRNLEQLGATDTEQKSLQKNNLIKKIVNIQQKFSSQLCSFQGILIKVSIETLDMMESESQITYKVRKY